MKTTIGKFDADTRSVPVTFEHAGVKHERSVNACIGADGAYDEAATANRVKEVAQGVVHKIEMGAITNPPPEPEVSEAAHAIESANETDAPEADADPA